MQNDYNLTGKFLIATPFLSQSCFEKAVIYMCHHSEAGAMGVVINQPSEELTYTDILQQLDIPILTLNKMPRLRSGGPVEQHKGLILHSHDYTTPQSNLVSKHVAITSTIDILQDIATGKGPKKSLIALGYAGWSKNQLEGEIEAKSWFVTPSSEEILFADNDSCKWENSIKTFGVDLYRYSEAAGHA
ncbi:YqgE/AlgH family protein [Rickettsiales bacterium]|nr:YqgE/AlgH family protein [Rickettsiales bacterium]